MTKGKSLEERANHPIELPKSPFFEIIKSFGRDETIDLLVSTASTAALRTMIDSNVFGLGHTTQGTQDAMLSAVGPFVGKVGFFPAHVYDAIRHYHAHSSQDREPLSFYLKKAFKEGGKNLLKNITLQDPAYIGLMWMGLHLWPETPPWMLSMVSTVLSVGALSIFEVTAKEALYALFQHKLKNAGFNKESYLESRFYIHKDKKPEHVLDELAREFGLSTKMIETCHDRYFPTHLNKYNGRQPQLRLRKMECREPGSPAQEFMQVQIDYTKASELSESGQEQFRYFLKSKDKFVYNLRQEMPQALEEVVDLNVRKILDKAKDETNGSRECRDIQFQRRLIKNNELYCAVDAILQEHQRPFYVIELKSRKNIHLLQDAMRFVMSNFPVVETTREKLELLGVKNYCR